MKLTFREVSFVSFCFTLIFSVEYCILLSVRREGPVRFKSENCPVTNCGSGWGGHSFYSSEILRAATELTKPLEERLWRVIQRAPWQLRMPYPRAIWACTAGTCCPPGQLKEMELPGSWPCPSVCSRSTVQSDHSCFRKTHFTDVPVMPCWVICNGALTSSSRVHPCCRSTVSWQLSSQQLKLAFPNYTFSCSPTLLYTHLQKCRFLLPGKFAIYMMISRKLWYSEKCFQCCLKGHADQ